MPEITLVAEAGRTTGSAATGRLRTAGKIPAVLYGHGTDPLSLAVDGRELRLALNTDAGVNALLELHIGADKHLAMAKALQRHPVRGTVTHVDFLIVRRDEVITADVAINLLGEAKEVANGDGVIDQQLFSLTVHTTPANVPHSIDVDISAMTVGDSIRVSDLRLPNGVTTDLDPETSIVVAQGAQAVDLGEEAAAERDAEAAEAEGEEGAEGEGASEGEGGGEAAAADDSASE